MRTLVGTGLLVLSLGSAGCGDKESDGEDTSEAGGSGEGGGVGGEGEGEGGGAGEGGGSGSGTVGACVDGNLGSAIGEAVATGTTAGEPDDVEGCYGGDDDGWEDDGAGDGADEDAPDEGGTTGSGPVPPPDSGLGEYSGYHGERGAPDFTYQWTAPATGPYTIYTYGSSFDTMLELRADDCDGETIECDDDGGANLDSLIHLDATGGAVYLITVDGYDGSEYGPFTLNIVEGRIWLDGDSGGSDEGWDPDSGTTTEPAEDPAEGSWAVPGLVGAWLALMGLGGALAGRRED